MMMNNQALKEKLSTKLASQTKTNINAAEIHAVSAHKPPTLPPTELKLVLTIPVPMEDAAGQLDRILRLLAAVAPQCSAQFHLSPAMTTELPPRSQAVQNTKSTAAVQTNSTAASSAQASGGNVTAPAMPEPARLPKPAHGWPQSEPSTDKQQQLLQRLAIRQRLSAEAIKQLLINKFGVESGAQLSKKQASELISSWI